MPYPAGGGSGSGPGPSFGSPGGEGLSSVTSTGGIEALKSVEGTQPSQSITKDVSYSATQSDKIFAVSAASASNMSSPMPDVVEVENIGPTPITIMCGYQEYSSDTATSGDPEFMHILLEPGKKFIPPTRAVIRTGVSALIMDGTPTTSVDPTANNLYVDSGANLAEDVGAGETEIDVSAAGHFHVNDLIQIGIDSNTTTRKEVMRITAINSSTLTVERALFGTQEAVSSAQTNGTNGAVSGANVHFPTFNAYNNLDHYALVQTNEDGRYRQQNFNGLARPASGVAGFTPGSIAIEFATEGGYQSLGMSGQTGASETGLTANTNYALDVQVDGNTNFDNFTITTSANTKWGGPDGVLQKLNDEFAKQFYTSGNLLGLGVKVYIHNGDIVFQSLSNKMTSAIALTAEDGSDASFFGTGLIPAVTTPGANGNINKAVPARFPDKVIYNPITGTTAPNTRAFAYDDGRGNILGAARGRFDYVTGAIDIKGPKLAQMRISAVHETALSGALSGTNSLPNGLVEIYANTPSQHWNGKVKVRSWERK